MVEQLNDPAVRKKLADALGEMSACMTRVDAEKDLQKEIAKALNEELGISKKIFNKMARAYHRQSFEREAADNDEFETLYQTVLGPIDSN